jgi:hypothetical protein
MLNNHQAVCRLCGKEAHLVEEFYQGYIKDDFYKIYFCKNCNTSFIYNNVNMMGGGGYTISFIDMLKKFLVMIVIIVIPTPLKMKKTH